MKIEDESLFSFLLLFVEGWRAVLAVAFIAVNGMRQGIFKCRSHPEDRTEQLLPVFAGSHVVFMRRGHGLRMCHEEHEQSVKSTDEWRVVNGVRQLVRDEVEASQSFKTRLSRELPFFRESGSVFRCIQIPELGQHPC